MGEIYEVPYQNRLRHSKVDREGYTDSKVIS
jgi:hypothetical protein